MADIIEKHNLKKLLLTDRAEIIELNKTRRASIVMHQQQLKQIELQRLQLQLKIKQLNDAIDHSTALFLQKGTELKNLELDL